MKRATLFDNVKECDICHRELSDKYPESVCPQCKENELFNKVREYIRAHDVTEYQVAEEFNIPTRKVKGWIKEGRIEYKEFAESKIDKLHCERCGAPITFGIFCQRCYKVENAPKYEFYERTDKESDKMRFLDKEGKKK